MKATKFFIIAVVIALIITAIFIGWKKAKYQDENGGNFYPIIIHSEIKDTIDVDSTADPTDTLSAIENYPAPDTAYSSSKGHMVSLE